MSRVPCVPLVPLVALAALAACGSRVVTVVVDPAVDASAPDAPDAPALTSRYGWGATLGACHRALARVELADGRRCGAVLVGPAVALTTAGCLLDRIADRYPPPHDVTLRPHGASAPVAVARVVYGRDEDDERAGGNWAALMLAAPVAGVAVFPTLGADEDRARGVEVVGYTRADGDELGVSAPCDLRRFDDDSVSHACGFDPALSGGVVLQCDRGVATLRGLTAQRADPRERARYNTVPLTFVRGAPLSPTSVTMGAPSAQGPIAYAFDADTRRVHVRARDGDRWMPWRTLATELPAGSALAGAALRTIEQPYLAVLGPGRTVRHLWGDPGNPVGLANFSESMEPVPGSAALRSIAATGSGTDRLELYVLDAEGTVYVSNKVDDDPNSDWSPWFELGRVPGAAHIAAGSAPSPGGGSSRHIVLSTPEGVRIDWSGTGYGLAAWEPRSMGFPRFIDAAQARPAELAVGLNRAAQPVVYRVTDAGEIRLRERLADSTAWTDELPLAPQPSGGVSALAAGDLRDGRAMLLGLRRDGSPAPPGEVIALTEEASGEVGFARARWRRFYR